MAPKLDFAPNQLTWPDKILGLALVVLTTVSYGLIQYLPGSTGVQTLQVRLDDRVVERISFHFDDVPRRYTIPLPKGEAVVEVKEGRVRVLPMPKDYCPEGICSATPPISQPGQVIVCLPNRMIVSVEGSDGKEPGLDGISR
ncbi:MAG: NusG domain II-containing protein [Thermincolia bacterium]